MDRETIVDLLQDLLGVNRAIVHHADWVSTTCPFATWRHERGTDSTPSFGIHVDGEETSAFNCFTCKAKGPVSYLPELLGQYNGKDYSKLVRAISKGELLGLELPDWENRRRRKDREKLGDPTEMVVVDYFDHAVGQPYLAERGLDDDTAELLDIRYDYDDGHGVERILFPGRRPNGDFYGFTGRAIDHRVVPKVRDYFGFPKQHLLLGAEHVTDKDKYIVLTEGLFDFAYLYHLGYPAVAAMHSSLTIHQAKLLADMGKPVILFLDNDAAGQEGMRSIAPMLKELVPLLKVKYPSIYPEYDPNRLPYRVVDDMIANADFA